MLSIKDLVGVEPKPNWKAFDYLVAVAKVALLKYNNKKDNLMDSRKCGKHEFNKDSHQFLDVYEREEKLPFRRRVALPSNLVIPKRKRSPLNRDCAFKRRIDNLAVSSSHIDDGGGSLMKSGASLVSALSTEGFLKHYSTSTITTDDDAVSMEAEKCSSVKDVVKPLDFCMEERSVRPVLKLPALVEAKSKRVSDTEAKSSRNNHRKRQSPDWDNSHEEREDSTALKRVKKASAAVVVPAAVRELPLRFKNKIEEIGGTELQFLIQKILYQTDLNKGEGRLSMPTRQIYTEFLRAEEKELLSTRNDEGKPQGKEVLLVEPSLVQSRIEFKKWDMTKENGPVSSTYVLLKPWNEVVQRNSEIQVGKQIQIWSFRKNEELGFFIVVL